jgi:archaea-specific RecJ-like exonuclease
MTKQCEACKGAGYINISEQECPDMVRELQEEIPEASINGGGHLVVGSIKFVGGLRTKVLAKLAEKIGKAEVGMG